MKISSLVYEPNNIHLRQVSSLCMSKYKEAQAFALNQLMHNTTHKFSNTAKELLLYKYDMWFRWLLLAESTFRHAQCPCSEEETHICVDIRYKLKAIANNISNEYHDTIYNHPELFNTTYIQLWDQAHQPMFDYLIERIGAHDLDHVEDYFIAITKDLIDVMANTLFELHEIDIVLYEADKPVFVSFDDLCLEYSKHTLAVSGKARCILADRLKVYEQYLPQKRLDTVILKDYSTDQRLKQDDSILRIVKNSLEQTNFTHIQLQKDT